MISLLVKIFVNRAKIFGKKYQPGLLALRLGVELLEQLGDDAGHVLDDLVPAADAVPLLSDVIRVELAGLDKTFGLLVHVLDPIFMGDFKAYKFKLEMNDYKKHNFYLEVEQKMIPRKCLRVVD